RHEDGQRGLGITLVERQDQREEATEEVAGGEQAGQEEDAAPALVPQLVPAALTQAPALSARDHGSTPTTVSPPRTRSPTRTRTSVGRRQHRPGHDRHPTLGVAEEAERRQRRRGKRQGEATPAGDEQAGRQRRRNGDERPAFARERNPLHRHIRGGLIQDIMARSRWPTSSILWSASRLRMARNCARLAWFSSTHSRANWPDWISLRIFFISTLVSSLTTRGPRV